MNTKRLHLRRFNQNDRHDLYAYLSNPETVKYEPYPPITIEQSEVWASHYADSEDYTAICLPENGKVIGQVFLAERSQQSFELGYMLDPAYQQKGYAIEAVTAILNEAFHHRQAHRVYSYCHTQNKPSLRLLKKLGMRKEGRLMQNLCFENAETGSKTWQDTYLYAILKEEWADINPSFNR